VGNRALAKQQAQAALALSNARDVAGMSAIALGRAGDSAQANWLAADLGKRFPEDTIAQLNYLPMIHAAAALRGSDTGKACVVANELIGALAHLQLGRAYALSGDTTKAKAAYQDFFALWKDADPDIPILKQAKAEYVKLQ